MAGEIAIIIFATHHDTRIVFDVLDARYLRGKSSLYLAKTTDCVH